MIIIFSFIFVLGLAIGIIFTTICHRKTIQCLAEQNVELVQTLKELDWTQEGEEWKRGYDGGD